jgi:hypothetical protein
MKGKRSGNMTPVIIVVVMSLVWGTIVFYATKRIIELDKHDKLD